MPLIRRLVQVGNSRGVILPSSWITELERRLGREVTQVLLEVDGEITIRVEENPSSGPDSSEKSFNERKSLRVARPSNPQAPLHPSDSAPMPNGAKSNEL
jgi:antitoxin component of MazEF toxin-antitoxin module